MSALTYRNAFQGYEKIMTPLKIETLPGAEAAFRDLVYFADPISSFDPMLEVEQLLRMKQGLLHKERYYPLPYDTKEHMRRVLVDYHIFAGVGPGEPFPRLAEILGARNPLLPEHHHQPEEYLPLTEYRTPMQRLPLGEAEFSVYLGGAHARQVSLLAKELLRNFSTAVAPGKRSPQESFTQTLERSAALPLRGRAFFNAPKTTSYHAHWPFVATVNEPKKLQEAVELSAAAGIPLEFAYRGPQQEEERERETTIRRGNVLEAHSTWFRVLHFDRIRSYSYKHLMGASCETSALAHSVQEQGRIAVGVFPPKRRFARIGELRVVSGRASEVRAYTQQEGWAALWM